LVSASAREVMETPTESVGFVESPQKPKLGQLRAFFRNSTVIDDEEEQLDIEDRSATATASGRGKIEREGQEQDARYRDQNRRWMYILSCSILIICLLATITRLIARCFLGGVKRM